MGFPEIASILLILLILGGALIYIIRKKRRTGGCIGCPHADACSKKACASHGEKSEESDEKE